MTVFDAVVAGISQRRPLSVVRRQDGGRERLICPHSLGYAASGELNLFCYQFGGYSSQPLARTVSPQNWRCYCVADISSADLIDETWQMCEVPTTRPNTCVVRTLFRV